MRGVYDKSQQPHQDFCLLQMLSEPSLVLIDMFHYLLICSKNKRKVKPIIFPQLSNVNDIRLTSSKLQALAKWLFHPYCFFFLE